MKKTKLPQVSRFSVNIKNKFSKASLESESKKGTKVNPLLRLNRKAKCLMVFALIAIVLISIFVFLPREAQNIDAQTPDPTATPSQSPTGGATAAPPPDVVSGIRNLMSSVAQSVTNLIPRQPGLVEGSPTVDNSVWLKIAANAWGFYKLGVGIDSNTWLPYAGGVDYKAFTDWDLGSYIQAIINAQKLNLTTASAASTRIEKVITFLENRPLNNASNPYWFYDAMTGDSFHQKSDGLTSIDVADTGRLFVALNNLKAFNPSLTTRINNIVYNSNVNRTNYAALVPSFHSYTTSSNLYSYYIISGFASFWHELDPVPTAILNNIINSPTKVRISGVDLPNASICNEPLLSAVFEISNGDSGKLMNLTNTVYRAHEAYFNETQIYMAPSEGGTATGEWWYEWVVAPNGQPWGITNDIHTIYYTLPPINYNKVAFGFLGLYNTTFARNMVIQLERSLPDPANGYFDGADKYGNQIGRSNIANTLILDAALYAVNK